MNNPRITVKERGLLKGAVRRVFSRSELRRKVLDKAIIKHYDADRPRVTKWVRCNSCQKPYPKYLAVVDHVIPLVPLDKSHLEMSMDEIVDRAWCEESNLQVLCKKPCHHMKSLAENKERRKLRSKKK